MRAPWPDARRGTGEADGGDHASPRSLGSVRARSRHSRHSPRLDRGPGRDAAPSLGGAPVRSRVAGAGDERRCRRGEAGLGRRQASMALLATQRWRTTAADLARRAPARGLSLSMYTTAARAPRGARFRACPAATARARRRAALELARYARRSPRSSGREVAAARPVLATAVLRPGPAGGCTLLWPCPVRPPVRLTPAGGRARRRRATAGP